MFQQAAREDVKIDVGGLLDSSGSRHAARFDSFESTTAASVGSHPAETPKYSDYFSLARDGIASVRIRLPEFDHGIVNRHAICVQDTAVQPYAFAFDSGSGDATDALFGKPDLKKRANRLRGCGAEVHAISRTA